MITVQLAKKPDGTWMIQRDGQWYRAPIPANTSDFMAEMLVTANATDVDRAAIVQWPGK